MSSSSPKADDNNVTTSTHRLPKQKLTALARLKSFGGTFVNQHKPPPIVFPPPSWELNDDLLGIRPTPTPTPPLALAESNFENPTPPEPVSFAKKLRSLIENLPIPAALSSVKSAAPSAIDDGKHGSPVPLGMDDGLVRMLSSEDIMNGHHPTSSENREGKERPGIWNILASLRSGGKEDNPRPGAVEEEEGGIMLYAPLEPSNDSQLELAECETVLVDESDADRTSKPDQQAPSTTKSDEPLNAGIEKHIWVPSTTQLSLLTTWWGYRLYLPPPVMAKLDGTSVKATARAAMLTTALKWLLDKIPMMLVPPQLRPAVKMLKQLSPVVGYIGVFIAWSWDRVRACDKGNGVVLTATWLLPVALLPMTWDAGDIYGPRLPPKPEEMEAEMAKDNSKPANQDDEKRTNDKKPEKKKSIFRW